MRNVVLGLGGNIGDHAALIERFHAVALAVSRLGETRLSSIWLTEAVGQTQAAFLNAACSVALAPSDFVGVREVFSLCQELERHHGRNREQEVRWGPRTLDIDLLLWGDDVFSSEAPTLSVPHPRMHERRFVLEPVCELVGDRLCHPKLGRRLAGLRDALRAQDGPAVERLHALAR